MTSDNEQTPQRHRLEKPAASEEPLDSESLPSEDTGIGLKSPEPAADSSDLPDILDLVLAMDEESHSPLSPSSIDPLVETARNYARAARSEATQRAYAADWRHFSSWCRRSGYSPLPADPRVVGLYLSACASDNPRPTVSTLERRLSGLSQSYSQRGDRLDRKDPHIAEVFAGIRRRHGRPPVQKEALLAEDILAMIETLSNDLRGLRDRAILLVGFAGGLRRSEIVGLDPGPDQTEDGSGWVEIFDKGALITLRGKTGWREVEIGRGSADRSCPVEALKTWMRHGRIAHGPLFRGIRGQSTVEGSRLNDRHIARLVKRAAFDAGLRPDLPEKEREKLFSGHSLRAGLASSAEVDERFVQKQLGHTSAEMTRRYQRRRDRFRVNLTKASGL
ncbi:tyrosine-type recombinase/integrase [Nitratireductor kimnyeongensis]|uniref:Tyrosine-type recombinase/integrase n=1 Tax=Nitratireductor kimnyeongensis TaxID=430679 RepID=A0ABW0TC33_9HYPH|nr:tyrosine-type recombinase/integrase [Nitratireductor kimnyeongensis]QZZ37652.1 tyrosine-type recombinase/integrase [Nitratireductor kimnyeongensis]